MNGSLSQTQTKKHLLPYGFQLLINSKVAIKKTNGQILIVSKDEVQRILKRDDLDVHRRRMYEAALEVWNSEEVQ